MQQLQATSDTGTTLLGRAAAEVPWSLVGDFPGWWTSYPNVGEATTDPHAAAWAAALRPATTIDDLAAHARTVGEPKAWPRSTLIETLRDYNAECGTVADAQAAALERLATPGGVAIVTGQQPALLGGPAYVIYKAVTAIMLARALNRAGQPAAAVFWIASEDHDVEEADRAWLPRSDGSWQRQRLGLAASRLPLRDRHYEAPHVTAIAGYLDVIRASLAGSSAKVTATATAPDTDWATLSAAAENVVAAALPEPGESLARCQARWLHAVFASAGLLLIEPHVLRRAGAGAEVIEFALREHAWIERELEAQAGRLGVDHVRQSHAHVFLETDAGRQRLKRGAPNTTRWIERAGDADRPSSGGDRGDTSDAQRGAPDIEIAELAKRARVDPAAFSTNYLTRPLLQASAIPTAAYVGGPGELRYQALLPPLLARLGLVAPALIPRLSATLVPPGLARDTAVALERVGARERAARGFVSAGAAQVDKLADSLDTARRGLEAQLGPALGPVRASLDTIHRRLRRDVDDVVGSVTSLATRSAPAADGGDTREQHRGRAEDIARSITAAARGGARLQERVMPAVAAAARLADGLALLADGNATDGDTSARGPELATSRRVLHAAVTGAVDPDDSAVSGTRADTADAKGALASQEMCRGHVLLEAP